jgi:hypothetical protein
MLQIDRLVAKGTHSWGYWGAAAGHDLRRGLGAAPTA